MAKFKYWESKKNGDWYWHLKASNGKTIGDGAEGYSSKQNVVRAINNFKKTVEEAGDEEIDEPK